MIDPTQQPTPEGTPTERREDIRAEYEAEFEAGQPAPGPLAKAETAADLLALLGPSPRQIIQRIELEFRTKIRSLESEIVELMERETHLKEANRVVSGHNKRLQEERDEWRAKVDPSGEIATLREDVARFRTLYEGSQKEITELRVLAKPKAKKKTRRAAKRSKARR